MAPRDVQLPTGLKPQGDQSNTEEKAPDVSPVNKHLLPEFSLANKVICVSGAARGLGLTQAEALLEAGAIVHALDRLEEPVSPFLADRDESNPLTFCN
jgi:hypothetical protein